MNTKYHSIIDAMLLLFLTLLSITGATFLFLILLKLFNAILQEFKM